MFIRPSIDHKAASLEKRDEDPQIAGSGRLCPAT